MREKVTAKLYRNVNDYLDIFQSQINQRDPALDPSINENLHINNALSQTPSLENFTGKAPLVSFDR